MPDIIAVAQKAVTMPAPKHTGPKDAPQNAKSTGAIYVLNKATAPDANDNTMAFILNLFFK